MNDTVDAQQSHWQKMFMMKPEVIGSQPPQMWVNIRVRVTVSRR